MEAIRQQGRSSKGDGKRKGGDRTLEKKATKNARKARTRDSMQALSKLAEFVDGRYRIVSQPPVVIPMRELASTFGQSVDQLRGRDPRPVPGLPGDAAGRSTSAARALRGDRHGPQGRRRRKRRNSSLHRVAPGPRPRRSAVPAGQGGLGVGARGPPARRAGTTSPASGWFRVSGGCRPPATSSSDGRRAPRPTVTSTGASCAT